MFSSSSDLLNLIDRNMRASVAENYVSGVITDTPTYEKNGWTGDAQLSLPAASLQFDTERHMLKALQDMRDDQLASGEVPLLSPGSANYGYQAGPAFKPANGRATPIWDAWWYVGPWEAYLRYGNLEDLGRNYPGMKDYLTTWIPQWFQADGDGFDYTLTSGLGDWDPPTGADAPVGAPTRVQIPTVIPPSVTAYVAYMAKITADSARALGKPGEAAQYDTLYNNIKADFNAKWWDASVGYYRENPTQIFAQTTQVLALAFDLVPADRRRGLQEKLVEDVLVTRDGHQMVGIAGNRWIHPVLSQAAREGVPNAAKAVYTIALQTTYPSFGYWAVTLGWTSLGEFWEQSSRTRNHHFFGTIVQWFYEELAGIQPLAPGYERIAIKPLIADEGVNHASASYDSIRGTIASSWQRSAAGITMDVTIPPNVTALVSVPGTDPNKVGELGSGRALLAKNAPGVSLVGVEQGAVVFRVGSGDYRFVVGDGLFAATEVPGTVSGTVPATLSLTLGPPATFGAFTPGVTREYTATTTANVISTAGDAALSVSPQPAYLANGSFTLPRPLQVAFSKAAWSGPVSNDAVTIEFKQSIGASDALRTGTYSKTLTFTLSTTTAVSQARAAAFRRGPQHTAIRSKGMSWRLNSPITSWCGFDVYTWTALKSAGSGFTVIVVVLTGFGLLRAVPVIAQSRIGIVPRGPGRMVGKVTM